ncbi:porin family protein [Flammeovirga sp. OC4]|uniref:porin family protein n=1 Tax=Flammeovirga sp. OC4 TaxID=1382345 RepID=UPI0005C4A891|nr:porin family protein [Flammeovirga sp. OC4]
MKNFLFALITLVITPFLSYSQETQNTDQKWNVGARIGFNLGASAPFYFQDMPDRFEWNTSFNPTIGIYGDYKLGNPRQSLRIELLYTRKGNNTTANVTDRYFKFGDNNEGSVTGEVYTEIDLHYIELPIQFRLPLSKKDNGWYGIAGIYLAYMMNGSFDGKVLQGSILTDDTGMSAEVGRDTPYDYSNDLVNFDWGAQFGAQKEINKFTIDLQISWGFNGIFPFGYETVDPNLFNLYGKIGATYRLY